MFIPEILFKKILITLYSHACFIVQKPCQKMLIGTWNVWSSDQLFSAFHQNITQYAQSSVRILRTCMNTDQWVWPVIFLSITLYYYISDCNKRTIRIDLQIWLWVLKKLNKRESQCDMPFVLTTRGVLGTTKTKQKRWSKTLSVTKFPWFNNFLGRWEQ